MVLFSLKPQGQHRSVPEGEVKSYKLIACIFEEVRLVVGLRPYELY